MAAMLCGIVVGNTTIRWIRWNGGEPVGRGEVAAAEVTRPGALAPLQAAALDAAVLVASVNPPAAEAVVAACAGATRVRRVGPDVRVPMRLEVREPDRVGADRLCAAYAAWRLAGGAAVVVDAGTAITVDGVRADGAFAGGAILAGPHLTSEALRRGTALLPATPTALPARVLGRTTEEALAAGVGYGLGGAVRALIARAAEELREPVRVVGTGGALSRLAGCGDCFDRVEPDLALLGVRWTHEANER